ncbi:MAG: CPBP family intramembrane metalloprotease [Chloracidobacterium sp.]|nr:CPBP family intramembrane metalloprotease [Chloracidobacterium sp.]
MPASLLALCGPAVAAWVVTVADSATERRNFVGRLRCWRLPLRWYIAALLLPLAISALRSVSELFLGATGPIQPQPVSTLGLIVFVLVAGEEIGWRGFVLPRLLSRFGRWYSSVILGVIWALWHLPLFYIDGMPQHGNPFAAFIVYTCALSVILTFLAERTRGSVLIATLFHGAVNTFGFTTVAAGPDLRGWSNAVSYGVVAIAIGGLAWGRHHTRSARTSKAA